MSKKILIASTLTLFLTIYPWHVSSSQVNPPHGIILISLDTLRADHLGVYGYHRNTSPSIDAFSRESIVFEHAVAQASWTLPSHMSIMTSLYPSFHGVYGMTKNKYLSSKHVTLAELLREGGYRTAAFTDGGWMHPAFGFHQGFDVYDGKQKEGIAKILPKVKKWLDENRSNPFFLFVHCLDIHAPYDPPPPYNTIFHDFTYTGKLENILAASEKKTQLNDEDIRHFVALYDGGIRYTDEKIGEFLSYLRESGLEDQSVIIIISDHGEEFMEHGGLLHEQLYYRPNLQIPLIMRIPDYPRKETRVNELVQSIDLLPTILEISGLPPHPEAQGKSVLPLIKKKRKNFINRIAGKIFHPRQKDSRSAFAEHETDDYSIITNGYQLIYDTKPFSIQLFDLKDDPLAQNNIAKDHDAIVERLLSQFKEVYSTKPGDKVPTLTLDEQTREQLKALGYLGGDPNNASQ